MIAHLLRALTHPIRTLGEKWAEADQRACDPYRTEWWDEC